MTTKTLAVAAVLAKLEQFVTIVIQQSALCWHSFHDFKI